VTGTNDDPSLYGTNDYGDYGLLSVGNAGEPPAETPFPDYYGLQIVSKVLGPYAQIVAASSSQSLVQAFAVRRLDGSVAVLLVNTDPAHSYNVSLSGIGLAAFGVATVYSYGETSTGLGVTNTFDPRALTQTLAPYSLTAVVFHL
jgi:hypothetical protein